MIPMALNCYGCTEESNNKLFTIGNLYLVRDQKGNKIEATLVKFIYDGFISLSFKSLLFAKGLIGYKRLQENRYPDKDIIYIYDVKDVIKELENRARIKPDWCYTFSGRTLHKEYEEEMNPKTRFGNKIER